MKKILYTIMSLMVAAFSLQSCEDVPAPYDKPGEGGGVTPEEEITAQGTGTVDDPYNIAGVLAATENLASGSSLDGTVYVKGVVTSVKECSASYGNATFYLGDTDDATKTFYVYRCLGLNNKNISSDDDVQEGDTITICGTVTNYNGTIETSQKAAYIYSNSRTGGGSTPSGNVIVKTCAEAAAIGLALTENSVATSETYSVTGYITSVVGSVSKGQQTFWIADSKDGGNVFEAYWANLPEGVSEFTVGSKVTIVGNIMKYNTTPEMKNATVTILEAGTGGGTTPSGTVIVKTCAEASSIALALTENSVATSETYSVTGYITSIVGSVSMNQQTFWMADTKDGGNVFEAYWANLPDGVSEFTVGSKVTIVGNIMKYNTTPEIKNATVTILEAGEGGNTGGNTGGGTSGGSVSGNTVTFSSLGWANQTDLDGKSVTVGDATVTFSKGSASYTPMYYENGSAVRIYGGASISVSSANKIASVVFTYVANTSTATYSPNGNESVSAGSYDEASNTWTLNATSGTISRATGSGHWRITSMTINYASGAKRYIRHRNAVNRKER